jgi:surface antigen
MKTSRAAVIACVALAATGYVGYKYRRSLPSNRTFEKGQCTWYALERAKEAGWRIRFDQPYGRHAKFWPERIVNAKLVHDPAPGELMVLSEWPGNPYGHVAYVESVRDKDHWTISHANMAAGSDDRVLDGQTIRVALVVRTRNSISFEERNGSFPLIGFLVEEK